MDQCFRRILFLVVPSKFGKQWFRALFLLAVLGRLPQEAMSSQTLLLCDLPEHCVNVIVTKPHFRGKVSKSGLFQGLQPQKCQGKAFPQGVCFNNPIPAPHLQVLCWLSCVSAPLEKLN